MPVVAVSLADSVQYPLSPVLSLAPWLMGSLIACFLSGIIAAQFAQLIRERDDQAAMNLWLASLIIVFSVVSEISQFRVAYSTFAEGFGQPAVILIITDPALFVHIAASGVVIALCQTFYAYRSSKPLAALLAVAILFVLASQLAFAIKAAIVERPGSNLLQIVVELASYIEVAYLSAAALDCLICAIISAKVLRGRRGFSESTDSVLFRIFSLSLTTSALTAATAVTLAVLCLAGGQAPFYSPAFALIIPRLFALSTLFTMTSKALLRGGSEGKVTGSEVRRHAGARSERRSI